MTFANSLDPDQAGQNVLPDLDPYCLTLMVFSKEFFQKISRRQKSMQKCRQRVIRKNKQEWGNMHIHIKIL